MPTLPKYNTSLLVRTDFSDDTAWAKLLEHVERESEDGFTASVEPVDDADYDGAEWEAIRDAVPENDSGASVVFVADGVGLLSEDHPILVVDLFFDNTPFRCEADNLWSAENNLNISNMDWAEFAEQVGPDGVFRGF